MTPCDNCIEIECEVNGYVCPLYEKYQASKEVEKMYTTDRAEQDLDDIRKVLLLYERGIIDANTVKDLINRIVELYVTNTVTPEITGQSCKTCLYYRNGVCRRDKDAMIVNDSHFCDSWQPGFKELMS